MILELEKVIPGWEKDPAVKAVILRGAGDRAFCAGGDVTGLYREMKDDPKGTLRRDFFYDEYIVNRRIYRYAKPWISLIDGIDMSGSCARQRSRPSSRNMPSCRWCRWS